jgi:hypothetical protein
MDHIVYAVPRRLMQAVAWFAGLTGVQPVPGGSHHGRGTANFLVGLGAGAYLEIIGPDPHQPQPPGGRWFGIDRLTAPRIVTWAIRTADIDGSERQRRLWATIPASPRPCPDGPMQAMSCGGGSHHRKSNSMRDSCRC